MSQVEITAGKLKYDYCDYSFNERTENGKQDVNVSPETIIHDDLRNSFRQLVPHLAFMCDYVPNSYTLEMAVDNMSELPENDLSQQLLEFKVTAFKISGSGDSQGVTITGQKKLKSGKVLNLNTPFLKWEDEYEFSQELRIAIGNIQSEIIQYSEGKKAPDAQMSLFEEDEILDPEFEDEQ